MSQTSATDAASSRFQAIFQAALKSYRKQTKEDLLTHPLISQLQSCNSTTAILVILHDQVREFDKSHSGDERLTKWLGPTVNVLSAFSAAVSGGVSLVFSPASAIFAGIGVFLSAAQGVAASKDVLAELFERIGCFFARLDTYTSVSPTTAMTDIITKILVEVLKIFGIATKELRRGSAKKFLRKLAGMADLEDALKNLDRLTQEEARMANAEVLRMTHSIRDGVKSVDGKVEVVGDKVGNVGDKVQCVDDKVQVVIDDGRQARVATQETGLVIQQTAKDIDEIKWNQLIRLLRSWLSPVDPSTNHDITQNAQHDGTAVWLFQGRIVIEWNSTGSLLWIHGKPGSGKSVLCPSVIRDMMAVCETGRTIMAYFYFDFRDLSKQTCHDLLRSLVFQLSTDSSPCCNILHRVYNDHKDGTQQPSDDTLKECLKEMLRLLAHGQVFIVLDALDECPDSSGLPPPRSEVLQLVKELVDLRLPGLYICATSRPEVDIRDVLESLAFCSVSLQDESGQKADIADYIRNVVDSSPNVAMRRWRADDKNMVIETLTERADGMFRWVFCQLDALQHCFPPNIRQYLNELPETLDETYKRILKGINKAKKDNAHRLLQCLTVAVRPLQVEELAELLALDFQASTTNGIPMLKEDWRWDDEEEAVLSTCSSLITVIPRTDSRPGVVQFSHFSVKEFLTSSRLARSPHGEVSRFHIDLEPAHTIMAQACIATLIRQDEHARNSDAKVSPLLKYAAQHWVDHARFEKVSSRVRDGMDVLFDSSKPHFAAWLQVHDIDDRWLSLPPSRDSVGSPLYYAASCGFYDLTERLITKHPEQVNVCGGRDLFPLSAALFRRHFRVADLLYAHGAVVDAQGTDNLVPLHLASSGEQADIMRWLLDHGSDKNARSKSLWTPLYLAALSLEHEAVQVLLEHNADANLESIHGRTPLDGALAFSFNPEGKVVDIVRRLLEHGADPNVHHNHTTPLHRASSHGLLKVARLLLRYGAKVDEKDEEGKTPLQVAASEVYDEMTKLLVEHGAVPPSQP